MDIQYEESLRRELVDAWNDGDAEETDTSLRILSHRMRDDEEAARFHFGAVSKIAQGPLPVPTAHMILHDCYRRGWAVSADPTKSLRHLELAMDSGSESARWFFGCYLLGDEKLSPALPPAPQRALDIFRDLARNAEDITVLSLAQRSAASYIASHFTISEVSDDDRQIVDAHASDIRMVIGMDHLHLARFYAGQQNATDYSLPMYKKSRDLLSAGVESRSEAVRKACSDQLAAWGVLPAPTPEPTSTEKAVQTIKVTGMLGGVAIIVVVWSFIGLFLMSIAAAINAVMIPIVLGLVVVGLIFSLMRRG